MLHVGSDDGVHRVNGVDASTELKTKRVLDSGRALRVRVFDGLDGVFAATHRGTLLRRGGDGWHVAGSIPVAESVHGRCVPLAWFETRQK